jgi:hypothetical protein
MSLLRRDFIKSTIAALGCSVLPAPKRAVASVLPDNLPALFGQYMGRKIADDMRANWIQKSHK